MSPDYGLTVAEAFKKYLKTGNIKLVEKYSARELKTAISRLSPYYDNNKQWYREVERRIVILNKKEAVERERMGAYWQRFKVHGVEKVILFLLGLVIGVVII